MEDSSRYAESGTQVGGYGEQGPYHCADCIHKPSSDAPYCNHVVIVADPDLQDRVVEVNGQRLVQISLEKGCCRYVKPPAVIALILRHGDTVLNEEGRLRSLMDVDINEKGQAQAQAAAQFFTQNYPDIKRIITTPLKRTQQTVAPTAAALGIEPEIEPDIITWDMGVLIGQKRDEVKDVLEHFVANPSEPIPQGESLQQVADRFLPAIEEIFNEAEEKGQVLVCITSSMIITLLKLIEGKPLSEEPDTPGIDPGGIYAVSLAADGYTMEPIFGKTKPAEVGAS